MLPVPAVMSGKGIAFIKRKIDETLRTGDHLTRPVIWSRSGKHTFEVDEFYGENEGTYCGGSRTGIRR